MLTLEGTKREIAKQNQSAAGGQNPGALRADSHEAGGRVRWDKSVADELGVGQPKVRYTTDVFRFADPDGYVHDDLSGRPRDARGGQESDRIYQRTHTHDGELMQKFDLDDMVEADVAELAEGLEDSPGF